MHPIDRRYNSLLFKAWCYVIQLLCFEMVSSETNLSFIMVTDIASFNGEIKVVNHNGVVH
jgi:hypothetical protein